MGREYRRSNRIEGLIPFGNDTLLIDTFDNGLKWTYTGDAIEHVLALSDYKPFRGSSCLFLANDNEAIVDDAVVACSTYHPSNPSNALVCSIVFRPKKFTAIKYLDCTFMMKIGAPNYSYGFRIDVVNQRLQYMNSGGTWTNVSDTIIKVTEPIWYRLSFKMDAGNQEYISVTFMDKEFDLTGIQCKETIAGYDLSALVKLSLTQSGTAYRCGCYFDNLAVFGE